MKDPLVYLNRFYFSLITLAFHKRHFRVRLLESFTFVLEWTEQVCSLDEPVILNIVSGVREYQADINSVIVDAGTFLSVLSPSCGVLHSKKMTSSCRFLLHRLGVLCRSLNSHLSCSARLCARIHPFTARFRLLSCSHSLSMVHPQRTGICHLSPDKPGLWLILSRVCCHLLPIIPDLFLPHINM